MSIKDGGKDEPSERLRYLGIGQSSLASITSHSQSHRITSILDFKGFIISGTHGIWPLYLSLQMGLYGGAIEHLGSSKSQYTTKKPKHCP